MSRFVLYTDNNGKTRVKVKDDILKKEAEEKREKKNRIWLEKWIEQRRTIRQVRFVEYLRTIVPKERWDEDIIRRYVSKVDITYSNECWKWLDYYISEDGYGYFRVGNRKCRAHRYIYWLIHGEILTDKPYILHTCNNPSCVNPNHLEAGTQLENMKHMIESGRAYDKSGSNNPNTDKEWDTINQIREDYSNSKGRTSYKKLSVKYGIPKTSIANILSNKNWKDNNYNQPHRGGNDGENSHTAKRTWEEVFEIREKYKSGKHVSKLAREYSMSWNSMNDIVKNRSWVDDDYQKWLDSKRGGHEI